MKKINAKLRKIPATPITEQGLISITHQKNGQKTYADNYHKRNTNGFYIYEKIFGLSQIREIQIEVTLGYIFHLSNWKSSNI